MGQERQAARSLACLEAEQGRAPAPNPLCRHFLTRDGVCARGGEGHVSHWAPVSPQRQPLQAARLVEAGGHGHQAARQAARGGSRVAGHQLAALLRQPVLQAERGQE